MDRHRGHGAERDKPDRPERPGETSQTGHTGRPDGCAAYGPLLEAYYHHALEPEQAQAVAEHAATCAACGATLDDFAATDRIIATAPMALPGPELRQRLAARIAAAGGYRSAETAASMSISRETVVSDMNDMNNVSDVNDSQWTRSNIQPTRNAWQRMRVWMGTAAAVLIVALLAGAFLTRTHNTPGQINTGPGSSPASSSAACNPANIQTHLPAHSFLYGLAMISPNEGWAVGSVLDANSGPANTLIAHYKNCAWTTVATNYPEATLMGISMDSATDGWAVGGTLGGKPLALHFTGGKWQQVTLPAESAVSDSYQSVHMLSANEGWIVLTHSKNQQGMLSESLLHFANGSWSSVSAPFAIVNDVLPVAANDAWIAGYVSDGQQSPVLYHYQAGKWTSVTLPHGVAVDRLRMVSPNNIWASGHISAASNADINQTAAVLHYDGSGWQQVNIGTSEHPQSVQVFDGNTSWAFTLASSFNPDDSISGAQYQHGGTWQTVTWPFKDTGLGFVSLGLNPIQRVAPDEYWTIGWSNGTRQPNTNGGSATASVTVLLYFANGAWHAYGN